MADETWEGGRVHVDSHGRRTFYIRQRYEGKRYEVSTGQHVRAQAMKHLRRWEDDPLAYLQSLQAGPQEPVRLTDDLIAEYGEWIPPSGREPSKAWLRRRKAELEFWRDTFRGRDLRHLDPHRDVFRYCGERLKDRHRRSAVKALFTWLRRVPGGLLKPGEGPDLSSLKSLQVSPEQWTRPKAVPKTDWQKVREKLWNHEVKSGPQGKSTFHPWRHFALALDVLGSTGWHVQELKRFIEGGRIEREEDPPEGSAAVLVCPEAKGGGELRSACSKVALEAARQLLAHGTLSTGKFSHAVGEACKKAKVKVFGPGQARHSAATWMVEAGADLASVAAFLNHKSPATTRKFYSTLAVARRPQGLL